MVQELNHENYHNCEAVQKRSVTIIFISPIYIYGFCGFETDECLMLKVTVHYIRSYYKIK